MEKRSGLPPIPPNMKNLLSEHQLMALRRIEGFGWTLEFVRRKDLPRPVVIIKGPNGDTVGIVEEDGHIDMNPDIKYRQ